MVIGANAQELTALQKFHLNFPIKKLFIKWINRKVRPTNTRNRYDVQVL